MKKDTKQPKTVPDLLQLLDAPIWYHRCLVGVADAGITGAILLSRCIHWSRCKTNSRHKGFFYKTAREWKDETGLTRDQQDLAIKKLSNAGVLTYRNFGVPPRGHFRVNIKRLWELLESILSTPTDGSSNLRETQKLGNPQINLRETRKTVQEDLTGGTKEEDHGRAEDSTVDSHSVRGEAARSARSLSSRGTEGDATGRFAPGGKKQTAGKDGDVGKRPDSKEAKKFDTKRFSTFAHFVAYHNSDLRHFQWIESAIQKMEAKGWLQNGQFISGDEWRCNFIAGQVRFREQRCNAKWARKRKERKRGTNI